MKAWRFGLVLPAVLVLAGCPADQPALDEPAFTEERAPEQPATPVAERAALEGEISGEIEAWADDNRTRLVVRVDNAQPNESYGARVQSGTCESPGPVLERLSAIRTNDQGMGHSESSVSHAAHLILDGNHIAAVYAPGTEPEQDRPVACATLPQTAHMQRPGM
jgi:hypothetical protein